MSPFLQGIIGSIVRFFLASAGTWLVQKGILNPEQVDGLMLGIALAVGSLAWSLWQKYRQHILLFTSLGLPPSSLSELTTAIERGWSAPANSSPNFIPKVKETR